MSEEWKMVRKKTKKSIPPQILYSKSSIKSVASLSDVKESNHDNDDYEKSLEFFHKLQELKVLLIQHEDIIQSIILNLEFEHIRSIFVLGIGNFSESAVSLLQLALILCLFNNIQHSLRGEECSISMYDPVLSAFEKDIALQLGFHILTNLNGKYPSSDQYQTLFYMPHCPYRLYCNVIWSNWFSLNQIIIMGNR